MTPISSHFFHICLHKCPKSDINLKLPWFFKVSYSLTEPKLLVGSKPNSFTLQIGLGETAVSLQRKSGKPCKLLDLKQKFGKGRKVTHSPDTTRWVQGGTLAQRGLTSAQGRASSHRQDRQAQQGCLWAWSWVSAEVFRKGSSLCLLLPAPASVPN